MLRNIFMKYVNNRKKLNCHTKIFYIKKLIFPLFLCIPLVYIGGNFAKEIKHDSIATALVSITAIIVAFLVFSMTILLTKSNPKEIPNTRIKYLDILINNNEVLALISAFTIITNLVYMYLSNLNGCALFSYSKVLNSFSFLAIYLTILIIKLAIDDLLFLSKSYE